jgi:hypothetical protein
MGTGVFVAISVDGARVASLGVNQKYQGNIAPGKHVLSIIPDPNLSGQAPSKTELTVVKGQTYGFTAGWQGGVVTLQKYM